LLPLDMTVAVCRVRGTLIGWIAVQTEAPASGSDRAVTSSRPVRGASAEHAKAETASANVIHRPTSDMRGLQRDRQRKRSAKQNRPEFTRSRTRRSPR
jgi:hypothetical protein